MVILATPPVVKYTWVNINMLEEVLVHKVVIALRMAPSKPHILVHIEGLDILERKLTSFVKLHQPFVHTQRSAACRDTCVQRRVMRLLQA